MERNLLRLHFRTGLGDIANGSNTEHRAQIVRLIKEKFDVPYDVELVLVQFHWLNVNMLEHIVEDVLKFLSELDLYNGYGIFNCYPMNDITEHNEHIRKFMEEQGFTGLTS